MNISRVVGSNFDNKIERSLAEFIGFAAISFDIISDDLIISFELNLPRKLLIPGSL